MTEHQAGNGPPFPTSPPDNSKSDTPSTKVQSPRSVAASKAGSETASKERWEKLQNLNDLYDQGFITLEEYKERKAQIINELTGTRGTASLNKSPRKNATVPQKVPYKVRA